MSLFLTKGRNRSSAFAFLPLRRQDINFERGVIIVARNLTRFGEGLPKTSYGEREVDILAPVRNALAEQQARVELKSTFLFYETRGGPLSLKVVRGGRGSGCFASHGCASGLSTSAGTLMPHCFFPRD